MQMKTSSTKMVALSTLGVMAASMVGGMSLSTAPVYASAKSKRNLAIGLGAVTAYGIVKKKKTLAIGAGLGTAYAYSRYKKAKKAEDRQRSASRYRSTRRRVSTR